MGLSTDAFRCRAGRQAGIGLGKVYRAAAGVGALFAAEAEERNRWFQLFDVYLNESASDKGIILAFKNDLEPMLLKILVQMREEGLVYGRAR